MMIWREGMGMGGSPKKGFYKKLIKVVGVKLLSTIYIAAGVLPSEVLLQQAIQGHCSSHSRHEDHHLCGSPTRIGLRWEFNLSGQSFVDLAD